MTKQDEIERTAKYERLKAFVDSMWQKEFGSLVSRYNGQEVYIRLEDGVEIGQTSRLRQHRKRGG